MPKSTENRRDLLVNIGFEDIGSWQNGNGDRLLQFKLDKGRNEGILDVTGALYAFCQDADVLYIGKTARTIRKRFVGYSNPGQTTATNARCNTAIRKYLADGKTVRVFVFADTMQLQWAGFPLNVAAGLEDALIAHFTPKLNGGPRRTPVSEAAEIELSADAKEDRRAGKQEGDRQREIADFKIILGQTYYEQGYINPGVAASRRLGRDNEPISVELGDSGVIVPSKINRRANANGSVRIIGNNGRIAEWFRQNFELGDTVECAIKSPGAIKLLAPAAPPE